jgi:hypothetical protein
MPFSSVLGASSAIKPGVVTSSTRPSAPYVGQLIFETDTNRLAVYNGSIWITQNGLQLIKTQTIGSAVSSVTVTNAFSATYDNYLITLEGGAATTSRALNMTLGSTTAGYYSYLGFGSYAGTTWYGSNNSNGSSWLDAGNALTLGCQANITLKSPFKTDYTTVSWANPGISTAQSYYIGGGYLNNTTSYTDFTLTMAASGTITGGTIRVYGYANN